MVQDHRDAIGTWQQAQSASHSEVPGPQAGSQRPDVNGKGAIACKATKPAASAASDRGD